MSLKLTISLLLISITIAACVQFKVPIKLSTDLCNQWQNCTVCLDNKFCGWCSTPVVYQDGSQGYQCAGFNPDNTTNPFVCVGTYSTDKCAVGYNCSAETEQCVEVDPGNGIPLQVCNATCYPKTYSCSPVNATCVETPANQGGIPLTTCQSQCKAQNNTPTDLLGHWRGLEISGGYIEGEWTMTLGTTTAVITSPGGAQIWNGTVSQVLPYLIVTITSGTDAGLKVYVLYQTQIGPVTKFATIAASRPGAEPPVGFDDAMTSPSAQEFVFVTCLDASNCNFGAQADIAIRDLVPIIDEPPVDHCSVYPNCTSCLDSPFCGWCSTQVIYQGNVIGKNCAGFNRNDTDAPFICIGTYSTEQCPIPAPLYACNATSQQCEIAKLGVPGTVCNATCGKNSSNILYVCNVATMTCEPNAGGQDPVTCNSTCQLRPFPIDLIGTWRGLQVNLNYTMGEYSLIIEANSTYSSSFMFTSPTNITLYGQLEHVASEAVLVVTITAPVYGKRYSLYEVSAGPETAYLTLANSAADSDTYPSFIEAMIGTGMSELNFVSCLSPYNCKFN